MFSTIKAAQGMPIIGLYLYKFTYRGRLIFKNAYIVSLDQVTEMLLVLGIDGEDELW